MISMTAPAAFSSHLHCSGSGQNYDVTPGETLDVDPRDVADLIRLGFTTDGTIGAMPAPVASTFSQDFIGHEDLEPKAPEATSPEEDDAARVKAASEAALSLHGA